MPALGGRSSRRRRALGVVLWGLAAVMAACGGGEGGGDGGAAVNAAPVAHAAGPTQRVMIPAPEVPLDGSRSSDADGDSLTYRWTLTTPPGSQAVLRGATTVSPTFSAGIPGVYLATLVVNDGKQDSAPSTVTITVWAPLPTADAGGGQVVAPGGRVTLNGGGSRAYLGALTYRWELTARPSGSAAALAGATTVAPTFIADLPGTYVASLVVNDGQDSLPSSVTITARDPPFRPVADAGPAQNVIAGALVTLDGSRSRAADGGPLTYAWGLRTPQGSAAALTGATTASPTFTADLAGTYLASLRVTDGRFEVGYAEVFISVAPVAGSCTSGGGGNTTVLPAEPTLKLQVQLVKVFRFSWAEVPGATEYRLLEDPDSASGYRQVASVAPGVCSHEMQVSLPLRVNASYVLQACNGAGCASSAVAAVTPAALSYGIGQFTANNPSPYKPGFLDLSADGGTLAVGTTREGGSTPNGAVFIFARDGMRWKQQAHVRASSLGGGAEPYGDRFGATLALSADGNTLAVGAPDEAGVGAAYVYTRSGETWTPQAQVKAGNAGAGDDFGGSLALSADGSTLAVGAPLEDSGSTGVNGDGADDSASASGAAYIFTRSGTTWAQQAYVKAGDTGSGGFGRALALSADGGTLVASALLRGSSGGAIYVFARGGASWAQQAYVPSNAGFSIALSGDGNVLAAGAPGDAGGGAAYVYVRSGTTWAQRAEVKASNAQPGDSFGQSLSLSADGTVLAVGAPGEDSRATGINGDQGDNGASASGAVYLFVRTGTGWVQKAYVKEIESRSDGLYSNAFGTYVAVSADGAALAVGSRPFGIFGELIGTTTSGRVYVY